MAVRVKYDPSKSVRGLKKQVTKATNRASLQKDIGTFLTDRVKFQARRGRPLNNSGRFPKLKPSTIEGRRRNKQKKHPAFSPAKSNLTITGQLIDAITFKRKSGGIFELFVDKSDRSERGAPNNRQLANWLELKGFVLFTLKGLRRDKKILKRMKQLILRSLRRELKD